MLTLCPVIGDDVEPGVEQLERFDPARFDYGEMFLSHARVYQLAHYKAIDPLRALALKHLRQGISRINLAGPTIASHNVAGIVRLARDVYENTDSLEGLQEPSRHLVSLFIARHFSTLQRTPGVANFLSEGGDIVMDIMGILSKGFSTASSTISAGLVPHTATRYVSKLEVSSSLPSGAFMRA